jgi:hypothetical protein
VLLNHSREQAMDPLTDKLVLICKAIDVAIVVNGRHRELSRDFSELFSYVVSTKEKICHYFCLFFWYPLLC